MLRNSIQRNNAGRSSSSQSIKSSTLSVGSSSGASSGSGSAIGKNPSYVSSSNQSEESGGQYSMSAASSAPIPPPAAHHHLHPARSSLVVSSDPTASHADAMGVTNFRLSGGGGGIVVPEPLPVEDYYDDMEPPPPPPSQVRADPMGYDDDDYKTCEAMYDFADALDSNIPMTRGERFLVVEDDCDGWTRVKRMDLSDEGYVPSSYLRIL